MPSPAPDLSVTRAAVIARVRNSLLEATAHLEAEAAQLGAVLVLLRAAEKELAAIHGDGLDAAEAALRGLKSKKGK